MTEAEAAEILQGIRLETAENHYERPEVDFFSCLQRSGGVLETDCPYSAEEYENLLYVQSHTWDNQIEMSAQAPKSLIHFVGRCVKKVIKLA